MQLTENLMSVSYEDSVITYSHIMYIVQYIRDRNSGFFLEHDVSLGKWFPLFWRIVVLLPSGSSSSRIAKLGEMCGVT